MAPTLATSASAIATTTPIMMGMLSDDDFLSSPNTFFSPAGAPVGADTGAIVSGAAASFVADTPALVRLLSRDPFASTVLYTKAKFVSVAADTVKSTSTPSVASSMRRAVDHGFTCLIVIASFDTLSTAAMPCLKLAASNVDSVTPVRRSEADIVCCGPAGASVVVAGASVVVVVAAGASVVVVVAAGASVVVAVADASVVVAVAGTSVVVVVAGASVVVVVAGGGDGASVVVVGGGGDGASVVVGGGGEGASVVVVGGGGEGASVVVGGGGEGACVVVVGACVVGHGHWHCASSRCRLAACPTYSVFQRSLCLACLKVDVFVLVPGVSPPPASARPLDVFDEVLRSLDALLGTRRFARLPLCTVGFTCWVGWSVVPSDFGGGPTKVQVGGTKG